MAGVRLGSLAAALASLVLTACGMGDEPERLHTRIPAPPPSGTVTVEARTPLLPTHPCSRCHEGRTPDPTPRKLTEFHTQKVLNHGSQGGWCYRCHAKDSIDNLRLADGELVSFDASYELCGSCHGDKLRDWKAGLHGLTTGDWSGPRIRRSCAYCHDPHSPHYPAMTPERVPSRPRTAPAEAHEPHEDSDDEGH
jgi:hypothetical protein